MLSSKRIKDNLTMKIGTLTCVSKSDSSGFRMHGNDCNGNYVTPPTIGKSFVFFSDALDAAYGIRNIQTSPVKAIEGKDDGLYFETESGSKYKLVTKFVNGD